MSKLLDIFVKTLLRKHFEMDHCINTVTEHMSSRGQGVFFLLFFLSFPGSMSITCYCKDRPATLFMKQMIFYELY